MVWLVLAGVVLLAGLLAWWLYRIDRTEDVGYVGGVTTTYTRDAEHSDSSLDVTTALLLTTDWSAGDDCGSSTSYSGDGGDFGGGGASGDFGGGDCD